MMQELMFLLGVQLVLEVGHNVIIFGVTKKEYIYITLINTSDTLH